MLPNKQIKIVLLLFVLSGVIFLFTKYNPATMPFPQCPLYKYAGIKCPGCGSQRALHQLLNGNISAAFAYNPLLIISLPYLLLAFIFEIEKVKQAYPKIRKTLFGFTAIMIVLIIVIAYFILRNVYGW